MKHYQYFPFNWNGCLAKTLKIWLGAYKSSLEEFGATLPDEEVAHHFGDWELPKYFEIEDFESCNFGVDSVLVYPPSHKLFYDLDQLLDMSPTYTVESLYKLQEQLT